MASIITDVVGYTAGSICMLSAVPQICRLLQRPQEAAKQSVLRNLSQTVGNGLWIVYGLILSAWPIVGMCAIATMLNGIITIQVVRAQRINLQTS